MAFLLIPASLVLLAAMFYLSVSVNEFERKVHDLDAVVKKRYRQPQIKSSDAREGAQA